TGEYEVDGAAGDGGECLRAVLGLNEPVSDAGQHRLHHLAEARVVVRDDDRADRRGPVREAEDRRGSLAGLAGQRQLAAKQPGQAPGVGEPEACAAPPRPWHLVELLEY